MAHAPGQRREIRLIAAAPRPVSEIRISRGTHRRKLPARLKAIVLHGHAVIRSPEQPAARHRGLRRQTTTVTAPALPTTAALTSHRNGRTTTRNPTAETAATRSLGRTIRLRTSLTRRRGHTPRLAVAIPLLHAPTLPQAVAMVVEAVIAAAVVVVAVLAAVAVAAAVPAALVVVVAVLAAEVVVAAVLAAVVVAAALTNFALSRTGPLLIAAAGLFHFVLIIKFFLLANALRSAAKKSSALFLVCALRLECEDGNRRAMLCLPHAAATLPSAGCYIDRRISSQAFPVSTWEESHANARQERNARV
jgi:hypothetical protein